MTIRNSLFGSPGYCKYINMWHPTNKLDVMSWYELTACITRRSLGEQRERGLGGAVRFNGTHPPVGTFRPIYKRPAAGCRLSAIVLFLPISRCSWSCPGGSPGRECTIKAQSLPQRPGFDSCPLSRATCLPRSLPYLPVLLSNKKDKTKRNDVAAEILILWTKWVEYMETCWCTYTCTQTTCKPCDKYWHRHYLDQCIHLLLRCWTTFALHTLLSAYHGIIFLHQMPNLLFQLPRYWTC